MMLNSAARIIKQIAKSKHLPLVLGIVAIFTMLPALKTGLVADDLGQRIFQLNPSQIPPELYNTGMVPENTGKLSTVIFETFGFPRDIKQRKMLRDYGIMPWWLPIEVKCALWRPLTAFTHWLDYRMFPDSPTLMHAHNIAWLAAVVILVTLFYRRIISPTAIAALAALMFVLDKNTYFPVMFVANRGFIVALCFGLLCFYMHQKSRSTNSIFASFLSIIFLSLSLLANEAGVSTFAFILAYALILDKGSWSKKLLSLLPAVLTIIVWRIIYQSLGYGVSGLGEGYIDPGHEPLRFLYHLPAYGIAVIAGQLSALPPDIMLGVNLYYSKIIFIFYVYFAIITIIIFLPVIRKDTVARFFFAVMIFAAIPIVAVPSGKNFAFVAIGAFGFIAVFTENLIKKQNWLPTSRFYKWPAYAFCIVLLIFHVPIAAISKLANAKIAPMMIASVANPKGFDNISLSNNSVVVIINAPCQLNICNIPFYAAYYGQPPIPKSIRALAFAYTGLEIKRIDEKSLVIKSKESNIFTSNQNSPLHFSHAFAITNKLFTNNQMFEKNRRFTLKGMTVDVLKLDDKNLPKELAFTFDKPLEHKSFRWLQFNWQTFSYDPFTLPRIGEIIQINDPPLVRFKDAVRFTLTGH